MQLTINPLKETELILYGGEFYNGQKVSSENLVPLTFFFLVLMPLVKKNMIMQSYNRNCFAYVYADICIW